MSFAEMKKRMTTQNRQKQNAKKIKRFFFKVDAFSYLDDKVLSFMLFKMFSTPAKENADLEQRLMIMTTTVYQIGLYKNAFSLFQLAYVNRKHCIY